MPAAGTSPLIRDAMNGALNGRVNGSGLFSAFNETKLTDAEVAAGIVPVDYGFPPEDLRRYGIVPNSTAARAQNSAYLKALLDPTVIGPEGWFYFKNTTGADTYYFDSVIIQIRDGCRLDMCGCTIDFSGSFVAGNNNLGFFTAIRDVEICNFKINVNYDGTAGSNNGMAIRLGARYGSGYGFAGTMDTFMEEALATPIGQCWVHDGRITSNNGGPQMMVASFGGLVNNRIERISGDGQNVIEYVHYYEFGDWHFEATVLNRRSSHAIGMVCDQITGKNLKNSVNGAVVALVGANPATVSNIFGQTCFSPIELRCGEALYFAPGPPYVISGRTRWHTVTNISGTGCTGPATFTGSESAAGGYLAGSGLTDAQQCDLLGFVVTNFDCDNSATFTGPFIMNGGTVRNGGGSGGIIISPDVLSFEINETQVFDAGSCGVRAEIGGSIRAVPRNKRGVIRGAKVCGSAAAAGISLGACDDVRITDCQLGYSTLYDNANEATQTFGVAVNNTGSGVVIDNNYCLPASGAAYNKAAGPAGCVFVSGRGTTTLSGDWNYNGPRKQSVVTYSASMTPDNTAGTEFVIAATNATAFTINVPTNPMHGDVISISIQNISGGALGVATFAAGYKLGAAWVQPANGFNRCIWFRYNGASWYEVNRTAADVAN